MVTVQDILSVAVVVFLIVFALPLLATAFTGREW